MKPRNLLDACEHLDQVLDDVRAGRVPVTPELWRTFDAALRALDRRIERVYPQEVPCTTS